MTTPTPEDDVKQLRDAIEAGPTPGPWEAVSHLVRTEVGEDRDGGFLVTECPANVGRRLQDAAYIAAANPARIARLLAHIDAQAEQLKSIEQAITDPENQPSQYGTVTLDFHHEKIKGWEDRFHRLSDRFDAQAVRLEAAERDSQRLDWLRDNLFVNRWNGVVGKGCAVQWSVAPDYRFKSRELTDQSGIAAGDFRRAIDNQRASIASEAKP